MTSEVSICNLALANLGDAGIITAITPPDGTVQAARCSIYYPHARRVANEARDWSFALRRVALADLDDPTGTWLYRYAWPSSCARVSKILPQVSSDPSEPSEDFVVETDATGVHTILTNTPEAIAVYVRYVTDVNLFSETFVSCLAALLASMLAGPLIKGKQGIQVGEYWYKMYGSMLSQAGMADGSQHKPQYGYTPAGVLVRR